MSTYINEEMGIKFNVNEVEVPPFLKDYLNHGLIIWNLTPNTMLTYYLQLRLFFRWLSMKRQNKPVNKSTFFEEHIDTIPIEWVKAVTENDIYDFLSFSSSVLNNGVESRSLKIIAIRSLYKYFSETSQMVESYAPLNIKMPKKGSSLPKYLSPSECLDLFTSIKGRDKERDVCIIKFFLYCGMRLSELVGINISDIRSDYILLRGKGRKERIVYLNDQCIEAFNQWILARNLIPGTKNTDALFISSQTHKRITRRRVEQIVNNAMLAAGLSFRGYTTHTLRHTAATILYQSGAADLLALQKILGHQKTSTTEIYTHLNKEQLRDAMKRDAIRELAKKEYSSE